MMAVEVYVHDRILKPVKEVFAAVFDPAQMAHYFISKGSGPLKAGTTVEWEFADVGAKVQINVIHVDQNRRIVYEDSHGGATRTTIEFESDTPESTVVTIAEATFSMDEAGVKRAVPQLTRSSVLWRLPFVSGGRKFDTCGGRKSDSRQHGLAAG
jgi:uncharacterized protein YndB with AHSA1/START domain